MLTPRPSIADMARTLNLACSTVSRALTQGPHVSAATRQRVLQLAEELQYQPNEAAVALRKGHHRTLGVLVPHITGNFFPAVVDGITQAASQAGYNVIICPSWDDTRQECKNLRLLVNAQVAGLLVSLAGSTPDVAHFQTLRPASLPLVFFDRTVEGLAGPGISSVMVDDYAGAYAAVAHLIGEGYRRIAHFAGPLHLSIYQHRHRGYRQALLDHGLLCPPELCHEAEPSQQAGAAAMRQLLALPQPPDAVFSASDSAAAGALQVLKAHGLRAPHDVALVGFSNAEFTALTEPPLTTVDQGSRHMGQQAVQLLLHLLRSDGAAAPPAPVLLSPLLLVRASSQRIVGVPTPA